MYGIQPIWPSEYASFRFGRLHEHTGEQEVGQRRHRVAEAQRRLHRGGASGDVAGICDDEPMCMHTTVCVSSHAAKNGSQ